jgi:two-component system response regulator RegX3
LRAKIEPEPARPVHLITLRGIGYRLDSPGRLELLDR